MSTSRSERARRLAPEQRREQLLELGAGLMATRPLEEITIEVIAEEAGISRGLMYHYFDSKQAFHRAVVEKVVADVYEITGPRDVEDPIEQLAVSLGAFVAYVEANYDSYISLIRAARGGNDELREIYHRARRALTDRIFEIAGAERMAALGVVDSPALRLMVDGWAAFAEEVVINWVADDHGLARPDLLRELSEAFAAIVTLASSR